MIKPHEDFRDKVIVMFGEYGHSLSLLNTVPSRSKEHPDGCLVYVAQGVSTLRLAVAPRSVELHAGSHGGRLRLRVELGIHIVSLLNGGGTLEAQALQACHQRDYKNHGPIFRNALKAYVAANAERLGLTNNSR